MADVTGICNRALQKLGAPRITSISESSVAGRACATAYDALRLALLRAHPWSFATKRTQLAALPTAPLFGRARAFPLPADFLRELPPDPDFETNDRDWQIEGGSILTDDVAPLNLRYIADVTDPNQMDPLFREALSSKLALELCEQITQSNEKKQGAAQDLKDAIGEAKKTNAIERVPTRAVDDVYLTARM